MSADSVHRRIQRFCHVAGVWVTERADGYYGSDRFLNMDEGLLTLFPTVDLICLSADGRLARDIEPCNRKLALPNLKIHLLPMNGRRVLRNLRHAAILWGATSEADVVCLDVPQVTGFWAGLACAIRRKPYIARVLGSWGDAVKHNSSASCVRTLRAAVAEWMARFLVAHAKLVLAQGKGLHAKYAPLNPSAAKGNIVHSTLHPQAFYQRSSGPLHQPIRILSVCGLVPLKGLDTLARATSLALNHELNLEWWCVGSGPEREPLQTLAASLGISSRVKFLGYIPNGPELSHLYREADIFVMPSLTEGVPLAMLEAMANSLPVVVSAVGGIPGVVTDGANGLLVEPSSPKQVADALRRLATDRELVNRLRRAAFESAQNYRSDVLWERQRQLIESTLGKIAS
jgi:glycosyltransferase involved in cell wall biosynthesis